MRFCRRGFCRRAFVAGAFVAGAFVMLPNVGGCQQFDKRLFPNLTLHTYFYSMSFKSIYYYLIFYTADYLLFPTFFADKKFFEKFTNRRWLRSKR